VTPNFWTVVYVYIYIYLFFWMTIWRLSVISNVFVWPVLFCILSYFHESHSNWWCVRPCPIHQQICWDHYNTDLGLAPRPHCGRELEDRRGQTRCADQSPLNDVHMDQSQSVGLLHRPITTEGMVLFGVRVTKRRDLSCDVGRNASLTSWGLR